MCFIQFTCTNLDGSEKVRIPRKGVGFPQKRGCSNPGRIYAQNQPFTRAASSVFITQYLKHGSTRTITFMTHKQEAVVLIYR